MSRRRALGGACRAVVESLENRTLLAVSSNVYDITAASYLGGSATDDAVRGAVIQADGTIVLAANISDANPGGLTPILLNSATATSPGAIVRLSADGTTVVSVTRLADKVLDLAADSTGNLYVAMWTQGFAKLDPSAGSILWQKDAATLGFANVQRLDAGPSGYVAVLGGGSLDSGTSLGNNVAIFDPAGTQLGASADGKWKNDIAIDEASQTVIYLGYRNATDGASGLPVQISYYRGISYTGAVKYTGYDWSGDPNSPNYINLSNNNMADTRGYRAAIGADGLLYLGFQSAGGNFIFRYDPFNISQPVALAGGDAWNSAYNITTEHITFVGRYNPATGAFLAGNEVVARLSDGSCNTLTIEGGAIAADSTGRVYVGGSSAWGLPLPTHPSYTFNAARPGFNPGVNGNYLGGAYLVVLDSTMVNREYATRLTGDKTRAIAARALGGGSAQLVFGGETNNELYVLNAIQPTMTASEDGWYGVIAQTAGDPSNTAPVAAFTMSQISAGGGTVTLQLDATGSSDANNDPLTYIWHFGDGSRATGAVVQHTFDATVNRTIVLTVLDDSTGWSQQSVTIGPPVAAFSVTPGVGTAPATVSFNASATTDPDDPPASLTYQWDFGDGTTATGMTANHTYARGGIFTVTLTVTDPLGAVDTDVRTIGIARDGGFSRRLDFQSSASNPAPGYTAVPVALYDPGVGYGYTYIDGQFGASAFGDDPLYGDYHHFSKYPTTPQDGTFLIDVPNGTYAVIARFSHKDAHSFPGMVMEGRRVLGSTYAGSGRTDRVFFVEVTDGQLEMVLIQPYWTISALEVIDIGPALQPDNTGSFTIDPNYGEVPLRVVFDATGHNVDPNLIYTWDFGDGNNAQGVKVVHTYAAAGTYNVTLTVAGGSGSRIVNFGGDYVSSNATIEGIRYFKATDVDGDGQADDTATFIPMGLGPTSYMVDVSAGGTKPSGRIFGGISGLRIDEPDGGTSFSDRSITNSGTADYINVRDQQNSVPGLQHRALLMWIKEDFLNGAHAQRVYFDANSAMSLSLIRWESLNAGRWVVQDGNTLYVSQATFSGTGVKSINPAATDWAVYLPGPDYQLDFDQANATFAPHSFTDIRSVGILLERDSGAGARVWYQINAFSVDAATAQANGTVTVIEPLPRVTIVASDPTADEPGGTAQFTVSRTGSTTNPLTVHYTVGGTASAADYTANPPLLGSVTIPAGQSTATILITGVDDIFFEGNETLQLSLVSQPTYYVDLPSTATVTIVDDEGPFVKWQGDYVTSDKSLRPSENGGQGILTVADFDGDGSADDSRRAYNFSLTAPLSPVVAAGSYFGPSATFYGGAVGIAYNITNASFGTRSVVNSSTADRPSIRFQVTDAACTGSQFDTVWVWQTDAFLDNPNPKYLGAQTIFSVTFTKFDYVNAGGRWLIGDGTQLYVSQATFNGTGTKTWSGQDVANSMWAVYNPSGSNIDFDQANAVFNIPISAIPVRAVGFISDSDNAGNVRHWVEFTSFSVQEGNNLAPVLTIDGDQNNPDQPDTIRLVRNDGNIDVFVNNAGPTPTLSRTVTGLAQIVVNGLGGDDTLILDFSGGQLLPPDGLSFSGGAGIDTLQVIGASPADAFNVLSGQINRGALAIAYGGTEALSLQSGTFSLNADLAGLSLAVGAGATAALYAPQTLSGLSISGNGKLDVRNQELIVNYTGASPLAGIKTWIASGYAGGAWTGSGLYSSAAAATPGTALGYADSGGAVQVKYTWYGDANLDGNVNFADLLRLSQNYNASGRDWAFGDFNYDGNVNFADLLRLSQNYNRTAGGLGSPPRQERLLTL